LSLNVAFALLFRGVVAQKAEQKQNSAAAEKLKSLAQKAHDILAAQNSRPKTRGKQNERARENGQMRAASNNLELETRCKSLPKSTTRGKRQEKMVQKRKFTQCSSQQSDFPSPTNIPHFCILFMLIFFLSTSGNKEGSKVICFLQNNTYLNRLVYLIMEYYMPVTFGLKSL